MSRIFDNNLRGMAITVIVAMPLSLFFSCYHEKKELVEVSFDPQTSYTLKETNVETLVSDSGVTRLKVTTATWLMYEKAKDPYWFFPDEVYLEMYDTAFNPELQLKADTAYNYVQRSLWKLVGNVDISNSQDERFQTSELFFDQKQEMFYSDSFIKITKGELVNTGIGFRSNKDMTVYEIYNSTADIPVELNRSPAVADTLVGAESMEQIPSPAE